MCTPSLSGTLLTLGTNGKTMSSTLHISNPNPQNAKIKYHGVRDKGYSTNASPIREAAVSTSRGAGLTLIHSPPTKGKFGKRVFMGNF